MTYNIKIKTVNNNIWIKNIYYMNFLKGIIIFNGYYYSNDLSLDQIYLINTDKGKIYEIEINDYIVCTQYSIIGDMDVYISFKIINMDSDIYLDEYYEQMVNDIVS